MKRTRIVPLVLAASISIGAGSASIAAASLSGAAVHKTTMRPVTKMGKLTKIDSKTSFTMAVGTHDYVVKIDDMTHVRLDNKDVELSKLKVGDTLTVKGPLEMGEIDATSVTASM